MRTVAIRRLLALPVALVVSTRPRHGPRQRSELREQQPGTVSDALRVAAVGTVRRVIGQRHFDAERAPSELRPVASILFEFTIA